ncbi:hypothetical protein BDZ91DRAFT_729160, partial [Kalaharituber pfeilii]
MYILSFPLLSMYFQSFPRFSTYFVYLFPCLLVCLDFPPRVFYEEALLPPPSCFSTQQLVSYPSCVLAFKTSTSRYHI